MPRGRGRRTFVPVDTTPTSIRNMLLGLDIADRSGSMFTFLKMTGVF